ncbi:MAG: 50S ribosomal protein L9 [Pseudomonadota bacterium]
MSKVILLEKIEKLGEMGDTVSVKPGYARNFLIPQNKALRATDANIAYFESQKAELEKRNAERKKDAEAHAKNLDGMTITLIRQAGETGQLYGSVTARDIADEINANLKDKIQRNMVELNQNLKEIGLFTVSVALHPEVKKDIIINIARTDDEAKVQLKTGKAVINEDAQVAEATDTSAADEASKAAKEELMDEDALAAEKEAEAKVQAEAEAEAAKKAEEEEARAQAEAANDDEQSSDEPEAAEEKKDA